MAPPKHKFWQACRQDNLSHAIYYLRKHPDLDVNWLPKPTSTTPLQTACKYGHTRIVELLLNLPQCNLNSKNEYDNTAMSLARAYRRYAVIRMIFSCGREVHDRASGWDVATCHDEASARLLLECFEIGQSKEYLLLNLAVVACFSKVPRTLWMLASGRFLELAEDLDANTLVAKTGLNAKISSTHAEIFADFKKNPRAFACQLRQELGWALPPARFFALAIFWMDDYLSVVGITDTLPLP